MRILFDVLGAPESSGGMRLYAESVINAWAEAEAGDCITVVGERWIEGAFISNSRIQIVVVPKRGSVFRIVSQVVGSGVQFLLGTYDAAVSVSPIASPLIPKSKRFVVVHDWRHRKNPGEFGRFQRYYRQLWEKSVSSAATAFVISEKTAKETREFVPGARIVLAVNGSDHVRSWPLADRADEGPRQVLTFGHHSNKRPELLISGFASLVARGYRDYQLVVLGASGEYRDHLRHVASEMMVDDMCQFPGFVSEREYQEFVQKASLIALVSSDEGYGLPVAEAAYFGIPCLATTDSGLVDIHGDAVYAVAPTSEAIADGMLSLLASDPQSIPRRTAHSWQSTADAMRSTVSAHLSEDLQ